MPRFLDTYNKVTRAIRDTEAARHQNPGDGGVSTAYSAMPDCRSDLPLVNFWRFPWLPTELQRMVWDEGLEKPGAHFINFSYDPDLKANTQRMHQPPAPDGFRSQYFTYSTMAGICRMSRVAYFGMVLPVKLALTENGDQFAMVDGATDLFFLNFSEHSDFRMISSFPAPEQASGSLPKPLQSIRNVAIEVDSWLATNCIFMEQPPGGDSCFACQHKAEEHDEITRSTAMDLCSFLLKFRDLEVLYLVVPPELIALYNATGWPVFHNRRFKHRYIASGNPGFNKKARMKRWVESDGPIDSFNFPGGRFRELTPDTQRRFDVVTIRTLNLLQKIYVDMLEDRNNPEIKTRAERMKVRFKFLGVERR